MFAIEKVTRVAPTIPPSTQTTLAGSMIPLRYWGDHETKKESIIITINEKGVIANPSIRIRNLFAFFYIVL